MTIANQAVADIFADARRMHEASVDRLAENDIRDAAEKAWCATMRASAALLFSRTGTEPEKSPVISQQLRSLAQRDPLVKGLLDHYYAAQSVLHGDCFYLGMCDPLADVTRRIQETIDYIQAAEALA